MIRRLREDEIRRHVYDRSECNELSLFNAINANYSFTIYPKRDAHLSPRFPLPGACMHYSTWVSDMPLFFTPAGPIVIALTKAACEQPHATHACLMRCYI